jgi:hypothetical protein
VPRRAAGRLGGDLVSAGDESEALQIAADLLQELAPDRAGMHKALVQLESDVVDDAVKLGFNGEKRGHGRGADMAWISIPNRARFAYFWINKNGELVVTKDETHEGTTVAVPLRYDRARAVWTSSRREKTESGQPGAYRCAKAEVWRAVREVMTADLRAAASAEMMDMMKGVKLGFRDGNSF